MPSTAAWTPALASAALIVAKSTLLLATAGLAARGLRRGSAAARHLVWTLALGGAMALPALALVVPGWKPAFLAVLRPTARAASAALGSAPSHALPSISITTLLLAVWASGAAWVLARLAIGLRAAARLARHAEPVEDAEWTELLERLGRAMEVRRPVILLRSDEAAMPLTWGALRPAILLPAEADAWPAERRRVVLLHELAHVARRDCLVQTLAQVCCALYWFHPGAWWAAREMRIEREQACDDRVLAAGARASDYAGHLLDVARSYRAPLCAAAIAMAAPSQLEGRVRAVLEARRDRRAVTRRTGLVCGGAVLLASLPLAAVSPSERAPAPREFAWELPPARSAPPAKAQQAAPASDDAAPGGMRIVATVQRAPRSAAPSADGPRTATPAPRRTAMVKDAHRGHAHEPALLASVDADGRVQVDLKALHAAQAGRPVRVRVAGHGATAAATVDIQVDDPHLRAMVATVAAAARSPNCPRTRVALGPYRVTKKFDAIVRSAAAGGGNDLAARVLDELTAGLARAATGAALEPETGGA